MSAFGNSPALPIMEIEYRLSPGLEAVAVGEQRLALSLYGRRITLTDESGLVRALLQEAGNGALNVSVFSQTKPAFPLASIESTVKALSDAKFLVANDANEPAGSALWQLRHATAGAISPALDLHAVHQKTVVVFGDCQLADSVESGLRAMAVRVERVRDTSELHSLPAASPALLLACSSHEDHRLFREVNRACIERGAPALFLSLDWHVVRCGPLVIAGATACYECYYHRLSSTRRHREEFLARDNPDSVLFRPTPSSLAIHWATSVGLTHAIGFLVDGVADLHLSPIREIDSIRGDVEVSSVLKLPRCPACGRANAQRPVRSVMHLEALTP